MWITTKQAAKVGFKQSSLMRSSQDSLYYKDDPNRNRVLAISNLSPQYVLSFDMTPRQYAAFKAGHLSLVPPDCCAPGRQRTLEKCRILHEGAINGLRHLRKILDEEDK